MVFGITQEVSGTTARNIKIVLEQKLPDSRLFIVEKMNKSDIVNSLPADLTVITANGTSKANYDGALIYAGDLEGKITKVNLTKKFTLNSQKTINEIETTTLFDTQGDVNNGRYIFKNMEATINDDNNLWLYFGTGNTEKLEQRTNLIKNRAYHKR